MISSLFMTGALSGNILLNFKEKFEKKQIRRSMISNCEKEIRSGLTVAQLPMNNTGKIKFHACSL